MWDPVGEDQAERTQHTAGMLLLPSTHRGHREHEGLRRICPPCFKHQQCHYHSRWWLQPSRMALAHQDAEERIAKPKHPPQVHGWHQRPWLGADGAGTRKGRKLPRPSWRTTPTWSPGLKHFLDFQTMMELQIHPLKKHQPKWMIPIFSEECKEPLKEAAKWLNDHIIATFDKNSEVEEIWTELKNGLNQALSEHVLHRQAKSKPSHHWTDHETKRLIHKLDGIHKWWKKSGDESLRREFRTTQRMSTWQNTWESPSRTTWGGDPTSALPQAKPTRPSVSSGATTRLATRRQKKRHIKPLFTHFLNTPQPLYGIPTLQARSRPLRRSNT